MSIEQHVVTGMENHLKFSSFRFYYGFVHFAHFLAVHLPNGMKWRICDDFKHLETSSKVDCYFDPEYAFFLVPFSERKEVENKKNPLTMALEGAKKEEKYERKSDPLRNIKCRL